MEATDLYALWGQQVRERRIAAGLTQQELADRCGSSNGQISNIERGYSGASNGLRMRLAAALDTTVADLFPYPDRISA